MMKPYIQDLIADTPNARPVTLDGQGGVLFENENEFIPWHDLGYNRELGFYRISQFPDVENQSRYATWTIHPVISDDGWESYALLDSDGFGFLLGERWQVAELLPVLRAFLEDGLMAEPISEHSEALGTRWFSIAEACEEANRYDPEEYPYETPQERSNLAARIRAAARRGAIHGWTQDDAGRYKFRATAFRHWLAKNAGRQRH